MDNANVGMPEHKLSLIHIYPNALMTLKEYLEDYASPDTREKGLKVIERELKNVGREKTREICERNLKEIENGRRDFRF